jgi:hypothetical protein
MKRQRGRGRKPGGNPGNRPHESNGPDVKIRGTAAQIYDKYMQYARDAHSAGDRVKSESYLQHAEHYFRIMAATMPRDRLQAAQDMGGGFSGASGGLDDRDPDDAPGSGLKVMDDASEDEGPDGEGGRDEDEDEFEASGEDRSEGRGEDQGRGRRRRGRRRRNEPGDRGNGQDTEARSALDALAQRQAAVAGS